MVNLEAYKVWDCEILINPEDFNLDDNGFLLKFNENYNKKFNIKIKKKRYLFEFCLLLFKKKKGN